MGNGVIVQDPEGFATASSCKASRRAALLPPENPVFSANASSIIGEAGRVGPSLTSSGGEIRTRCESVPTIEDAANGIVIGSVITNDNAPGGGSYPSQCLQAGESILCIPIVEQNDRTFGSRYSHEAAV